MAMGRVEFANGVASVYDELGRRRTVKHCDKLIGYGPRGFVIKYHGFYLRPRSAGRDYQAEHRRTRIPERAVQIAQRLSPDKMLRMWASQSTSIDMHTPLGV